MKPGLNLFTFSTPQLAHPLASFQQWHHWACLKVNNVFVKLICFINSFSCKRTKPSRMGHFLSNYGRKPCFPPSSSAEYPGACAGFGRDQAQGGHVEGPAWRCFYFNPPFSGGSSLYSRRRPISPCSLLISCYLTDEDARSHSTKNPCHRLWAAGVTEELLH